MPSTVVEYCWSASSPPSSARLSPRISRKSQTTIRQHLQKLVTEGIVEEVSLPKDQRQNDLPYKFYGLSEDGREFLEEHGLLRAEETLGEIYSTIEKTEAIQRYETAPRPDR